MKLYHGTSARLLKQIVEHGIQPREWGERESNWEEFPSRQDLVYLTTTYAPYFANMALSSDLEDDHTIVLFEVESEDLDPELFLPDEDAIAQSLASHQGRPLAEVHQEVLANLEAWGPLWEKAVEHMGNCAYKGWVPQFELLRYATFDIKARKDNLWMTFTDPCITPINHMIKGDYYKQLISWMFCDTDTLPHVEEATRFAMLPGEMGKRQLEIAKAMSADRSGIEVVRMQEPSIEEIRELEGL